MPRVIGLISGTSVDGIDAALVDITGTAADLQVQLVAGATYPYPPALRSRILAVCAGEPLTVAALADLDDAIATAFAQAAQAIQADHEPATLIGSHGQTVFHRPPENGKLGYSVQLGRGDLIAAQTGLCTVSDFRAADLAAGGHGAPLVPAVDAVVLAHPDRDRCVQNIGGIGNVAYLPAKGTHTRSPEVRGWDTGPGNVLIDLAVQHLSEGTKTYDAEGAWAAQGTPCEDLVQQWLQHPFFQLPPPKSTGRELFGPAFLRDCLAAAQARGLAAADCLATLTDFTAATIADSYRRFLPRLPAEVLVAGGGSKNPVLCQRLQAHLPEVCILPTDTLGLSADFKEAIAFAVLAHWRLQCIPSNLPEVTGARVAISLGTIHPVRAL